MGVKLNREKEPLLLLKAAYFLDRILPISNKVKLKLYLNLEWIFDRFCHEYSFKNYSSDTHPVRMYTRKFLLDKISNEDIVLDLGCHDGVMSNYLSSKAKYVVGVDNNCSAINLAKSRYVQNNIDFICQDAYEYLNKTDRQFSVLILSHILEHLDNPISFINRYKDFFEYIYIELPDFDKSYLNHYRNDLSMSLIYTDEDHVSEFDRMELMSIINSCNLDVMESSQIFGLHRYWCKVVK